MDGLPDGAPLAAAAPPQQQPKRDEWSESGISRLLEAYEAKWLLRNRAKLKWSDWVDIAHDVSAHCSSKPGSAAGGTAKTPNQCKNKVESMKKRYRAESAAATRAGVAGASSASGAPSWRFFGRMDGLLKGPAAGCSGPVAQAEPSNDGMVQPRAPPKAEPEVDAEADIALQQPPDTAGPPGALSELLSADANGSATVKAEKAVEQVVHKESSRAADSDAANVSSPRSKEVEANDDAEEVDTPRKRKSSELDVARSIELLASSFLKIERARLEVYRETEKMRAEAEVKRGEMELRRTEIMAKTQLQIARLFAKRLKECVGSNGGSSSQVGTLAKKGENGGFHLMSCLKDVPTLKGDNYTEWRKKVDLAFICAKVDWVVDEPQPVRPTEPVRESTDDDAAWNKKKSDHAPIEMKYTLENQKWINANKKCMAFIKNTIENAIAGSIAECTSVGELLTKIKSQFTGSSKTYATQLIKQLVTMDYTGGGTGIREHILRMSNMASKLKPMDADLEIKPALLVHLVMASLPKHFDTFVVNYNMSPEKWDIEKTIAMCVQEEDRLKASNGGSLNYVKGKQKKYGQSDKGSPSKPYGKASTQHQQKSFSVDKDTCLHCKQKGHYKKDCADWLKSIMAKKWIPFDADYAKKRKMH